VDSRIAIDPGPDREDDFTGPPVTAAEVALLQDLATVYGELALEVAARAKAAARPVTAVRSEAAAKLFAEQVKRGELLSRTVRLTLGLKSKLVMDLQTWRKRGAEAAQEAEERRTTRRKAQQENATAIVLEIVAKTEGASAAADAKQPIQRWFAERDHERQLSDRPVGEIVAMLCRDLSKIMSPQDWQGRPWAAAAEALFRRAAQDARRGTGAVDPAPEDADADPAPTQAAAPEPEGEPSAPAQPVMPPEAVAAAFPDETAPPAGSSGLRPGMGADPPEQYAYLDRSRPEVRALLAEWGYRTD
jgi:hypothetical protein